MHNNVRYASRSHVFTFQNDQLILVTIDNVSKGDKQRDLINLLNFPMEIIRLYILATTFTHIFSTVQKFKSQYENLDSHSACTIMI